MLYWNVEASWPCPKKPKYLLGKWDNMWQAHRAPNQLRNPAVPSACLQTYSNGQAEKKQLTSLWVHPQHLQATSYNFSPNQIFVSDSGRGIVTKNCNKIVTKKVYVLLPNLSGSQEAGSSKGHQEHILHIQRRDSTISLLLLLPGHALNALLYFNMPRKCNLFPYSLIP